MRKTWYPTGIPYASIEAAGVHGVVWRLPQPYQIIERFLKSCKIIAPTRCTSLHRWIHRISDGCIGLRNPLLYVPDIEPGCNQGRLAFPTDCTNNRGIDGLFPDKSKLTVTGYPVRPELKTGPHGCQITSALTPTFPTLAVTGRAEIDQHGVVRDRQNYLRSKSFTYRHLTSMLPLHRQYPACRSGKSLPGFSLPA